MGMYDEITVHALGDQVYQTKDLECEMAVYHIGQDGKFTIKQGGCHNEATQDDCNQFSGTVWFYGHEQTNRWAEYMACIHRGQCIRIDKLKDGEWVKRFTFGGGGKCKTE